MCLEIAEIFTQVSLILKFVVVFATPYFLLNNFETVSKSDHESALSKVHQNI
jgi:hypothetical protein